MNLWSAGLVSVLLLLVCGQAASEENFNYDEFKEKSLLFALKSNEKSSFSSDIEIVFSKQRSVTHIEEKFSFDLSIGEYVGQEIQEDADGNKTRFTAKLLYLDDLGEIYQISKDGKKCDEQDKDMALDEYFLKGWAPLETYNKSASYPILGPNVLWWLFLEKYEQNRDNVTCEAKSHDPATLFPTKVQCQTVYNDVTKIIYDFAAIIKGETKYSMVPDKIRVFAKDEENNENLYTQSNYFKFTYDPDPKQPIVSNNLPIGYGCTRSTTSKQTYPKVETNYGERFELEYEVVFTYPETDANRKPDIPNHDVDPIPGGGKPPNNGTDPNPVSDPKPKPKQITEIFYNKMYHNADGFVNVVDTVDEFQGSLVPTRTIYDFATFVNYDILYLEEKKCHSYHLTQYHKINFHYVQDLFINYPQFFRTENQYEYIGEYKVRNIPTLVFEKKISNFNRKADNVDGDNENDLYLRFFRNNTNLVESDFATVTHYYPAVEYYWSNRTNAYQVPMKIEIRLFNNETRENQVASLTINVASFKHDAGIPQKGNNDVFDVSACVENEFDYDWFLVKFDDSSDNTKRYRKYSSQISNAFRALMDISPIRLGEILVDGDDIAIYVTAKLLEVAQTLGYFRTNEHLTIKEDSTGVVKEFAESEELCTRRCFSNKNCGAFSYCASLNCLLWFDDDFDELFDPSLDLGTEYDWTKIPTEPNSECTYGHRIVKYKEHNHQSNKEFLAKLYAKITAKDLDPLLVTDENFSDDALTAAGLEINVQPGRHTASKPGEEDPSDQRNHVKYNDLFQMADSHGAFSKDKVSAKQDDEGKNRLVSSTLGVSLWECQFLCINDENCKSMSYCRGTDECILTTIKEFKEIAESTQVDHKCGVAAKKFTAYYHKVPKKGLVEKYTKKRVGRPVPLSDNICASGCQSDPECKSFDFCVGKPLKKNADGPEEEKQFACYYHYADPEKDNIMESEKWDSSTRCDHYSERQTHQFIEHSTRKMKEESAGFIGTESKISLDQCASKCIESEFCNTFDYCFEKNNEGHLDTMQCRWSNQVYSDSTTEKDQFDCSVYSKIAPRKLVQKVEKLYDNPVSAGLTTFLSILFLVVGAAVGFAAAYYTFKYYFVSY